MDEHLKKQLVELGSIGMFGAKGRKEWMMAALKHIQRTNVMDMGELCGVCNYPKILHRIDGSYVEIICACGIAYSKLEAV